MEKKYKLPHQWSLSEEVVQEYKSLLAKERKKQLLSSL